MARPKGTKYIENADKMWEHFLAYKKWAKENPIKIEDYVGKDAIRVMREKPRALTIEGFENWCFEKEIISDLGKYFSNDGGNYEDYRTICSRIKQVIRQDQIEGGMAGIYNPSITQRLQGLTEKQEHKHEVKETTPIFSNNPLLGKVKDE